MRQVTWRRCLMLHPAGCCYMVWMRAGVGRYFPSALQSVWRYSAAKATLFPSCHAPLRRGRDRTGVVKTAGFTEAGLDLKAIGGAPDGRHAATRGKTVAM